MRALVVVDLGFGDGGKGLLVDALVRRTGARLVVRFNGGAQAGHNVVTDDGRRHTFAQFGAGTFVPGTRTFLSRHVLVHPTALLLEAEALRGQSVEDALERLRLSEGARVITPFHQALGRLRELARGPERHGSCGVGVGETARDALLHPDEALRAGDLRDPATLRRKLARASERLRDEALALGAGRRDDPRVVREVAVFEVAGLAGDWAARAAELSARGLIVPDAHLAEWAGDADTVVFEGAQGLLLDEWSGLHPYTTWSDCTAAQALALIEETWPGARALRLGVLRAHAVRHGPGPLPTETEALRGHVREHNRAGEWQGPVRYGWFDAVLARYALDTLGGVDRLALTHLDLPPRLPAFATCDAYLAEAPDAEWVAARDRQGHVTRLRPPHTRDLARQAALTAWLGRVRPVLSEGPTRPDAVRARVEDLLGRRVDVTASGPRAGDLDWRDARPELDLAPRARLAGRG